MANCRDGLGGGLQGCGEVLSEMLVDYGGVDDLPNPFFVAAGKEDEIICFESENFGSIHERGFVPAMSSFIAE